MSQFHLTSKVIPSPDTASNASPRQILKSTAQVLVALPAEVHQYGLPAPSSHRRRAGAGLHIFASRITGAITPQLTIESGGSYLTCWKTAEDLVSRVLPELIADLLSQLFNLTQQGTQHMNKAEHYGLMDLFHPLGRS